jgi:hypothetical protein
MLSKRALGFVLEQMLKTKNKILHGNTETIRTFFVLPLHLALETINPRKGGGADLVQEGPRRLVDKA